MLCTDYLSGVEEGFVWSVGDGSQIDKEREDHWTLSCFGYYKTTGVMRHFNGHHLYIFDRGL